MSDIRCPCCENLLTTTGSALKCDFCGCVFFKKNASEISMTKGEVSQEARRIEHVLSAGKALVIGDKRLAERLASKKLRTAFTPDAQSFDPAAGPFELIHLPFLLPDPAGLPEFVANICGALSDTGVLRVLTLNARSRTVSRRERDGDTALTDEGLIAMLDRAGFRSIVLDRRSFLRGARLMAGQNADPSGAALTACYRLPAWFEARFGQGAVLAAFAWK